MYFNHLEQVGQTYYEHFVDSISFSFNSFKASFFFLFHAFYPDIFVKSGSNQINYLHNKIQNKYKNLAK